MVFSPVLAAKSCEPRRGSQNEWQNDDEHRKRKQCAGLMPSPRHHLHAVRYYEYINAGTLDGFLEQRQKRGMERDTEAVIASRNGAVIPLAPCCGSTYRFRMPSEPTPQDIDNAAPRAAVAQLQKMEYVAVLKLALGAF